MIDRRFVGVSGVPFSFTAWGGIAGMNLAMWYLQNCILKRQVSSQNMNIMVLLTELVSLQSLVNG